MTTHERVLDLVDQQVRRALLGNQVAASEVAQPLFPKPVVTISRELGSGGRRVAEILSEALGFSLWDGELVEQMAADAHVEQKLIENFDEHVISEIEVLLRHLAGEPRIGGFQYKRHLTRTILQIAKLGNAIILGRGANFIVPQALNVRIIASRELRIHNLMQYESYNRHDAIRHIEESDRERTDYAKRLFGRDWHDALAYDLTLRIDEFDNQQAAEVIIRALEVRFKVTFKRS